MVDGGHDVRFVLFVGDTGAGKRFLGLLQPTFLPFPPLKNDIRRYAIIRWCIICQFDYTLNKSDGEGLAIGIRNPNVQTTPKLKTFVFKILPI